MSQIPGKNKSSDLKCPDCGGAISEEDVHCPHCGVNLDEPVSLNEITIDSFSKHRRLSFALEPGGEKRLLIAWNGVWNEVTIFFDQKPIGVIPNKKALDAGQEFVLPDGASIKVQFDKKTGLNILRNGLPLAGSASDPKTVQKNAYELAYGMVFFVGGLNLLLGLLTMLFRIDFLDQLYGNGIYVTIFGLTFFLLGFLIKRKSVIALYFAITIFGLDGIVALILMLSQGSIFLFGFAISRILFITPMIKGVKPLIAIKKQIE